MVSEVKVQKISGIDLWQWRNQAKQEALAADVPVGELDWLLENITGLEHLALQSETFKTQDEILLSSSMSDVSSLWNKRLNDRVPVEYLIGLAKWRKFSLLVSPDVLIPRPETEGLIDMAIAAVKNSSLNLTQGHWADLGTGSGAIAIALADAFPDIIIHAVDCDAAALNVAKANAKRYGVADRINFYQGSWFEPLAHLKGKFSGMIANPPYVPTSFAQKMQPEVAYEPQFAVYGGGVDGLEHVRHLIKFAPDYLISGGVWLLEMMVGQAEVVTQLLQTQGGYQDIQIHIDYAGRNRLTSASRI
ncbi:modification methylase HemK [Scytonema sp. HK-05]|uniref:peptide chain release factor N(5)-glutamine methyltransferase n=1 Tax=Scytonema sp. HK-05 TaxID=1137095 RepID=UPI000A651A9C|nr:modification methylase HemK [Scytonema sp. HK-05]